MKEMKVTFRELEWKDRIHFHKWINDKEAIKYSLSIFQNITTEDEIDTWFGSVINDKKSLNKAIIFKNKFIGYAGISSINEVNNCGEYFIFIGNKNSWGEGIGSHVTKLFIEIAFKKLSLNRLSLTVSDENFYAFKAYKNAGFIEEGRLRKACYRDREYHDKIMMSIISEDMHKKWPDKNFC